MSSALQELKCTEEQFPYGAVEKAGYQAAVFGQKTYNGVAILARSEIEDITTGFQDGEDDPEARLIAATVDGARIISVYVVNGKRIDHEKYGYKLGWLARLERYLEAQDLAAPLAICGDFNIAPDRRDVEKVELWEGGVLYNEDLSSCFRRLLDLGLVDTFRTHHGRGRPLLLVGLPHAGVPEEQRAAHRPHPRHTGARAALHRRLHRPRRAQGAEAFRPRPGADGFSRLGRHPAPHTGQRAADAAATSSPVCR